MSTHELPLQSDIDFLPARFREQCAQRKTRLLHAIAAGVFACALMCCALWQWQAGRTLNARLEAIAPIHERAHQRTVQLTTLKEELTKAEQRAELLTYLRHPWPKTQLVAAVIEPMPASIRLSELVVGRLEDTAANAVLPSQRARNANATATSGDDAKKVKQTPTQADLKRLRDEFDPRVATIMMSGETTDVSQLHEYLGELGRHPLIVKAELRSIESGGRESQATRFRARIVVRAGYGQPLGPVPSQQVGESMDSVQSARQAATVEIGKGNES